MSLQTLPNDILLGILQHIPSLGHYYLLGIFQRLRAIALPKIYSHIYITFNECFTNQKRTTKLKKSILQSVGTNADIIALASCTHMVKSVEILVYGSSTTCTEFQYPIKALQACANSWPNITKLDIQMYYNNYCSNLGDTHPTPSPQLCKKYSQELAHIMPNVTELLLVNRHFNSAISELYIQVTDVYANQLVGLVNEYEIDHAGSQKLEVIKHLYMDTYSNKVLPRINSHTLVELYIENIPANVSWASFMNSKDDKVIEFSCLKWLHMDFFPYDATLQNEVNKPELLLNFPELRSLDIVCHTEVCHFFHMAKFPDVMDNINITAPPALLAQLKDTKMPTAKTLTMRS